MAAVTREPGRFSRWPRSLAAALLLLVAALILYGATVQPGAGPAATQRVGTTDVELYRAIAARVGAGEDYYAAAGTEQRAGDYPLKPFVTVRLPTLAHIVARLGDEGAAIALAFIALAAGAAWIVRLRAITGGRAGWAVASVLMAVSSSFAANPALALWHEAWAALLVALSLGVHGGRRVWPSLLLGLAAVLVRELALPYLFVMAALAWREYRRLEAIAWTGAIALFAAALAAHASAVGAVVLPEDLASPGWSSAGGWPFILAIAQTATPLLLFPVATAFVAVPLALLGWAGAGTLLADRAALLLLAYVAAFSLVGRADNLYWGLMLAPLLLAGFALAPRALGDLWSAATRPHPSPAAAGV